MPQREPEQVPDWVTELRAFIRSACDDDPEECYEPGEDLADYLGDALCEWVYERFLLDREAELEWMASHASA